MRVRDLLFVVHGRIDICINEYTDQLAAGTIFCRDCPYTLDLAVQLTRTEYMVLGRRQDKWWALYFINNICVVLQYGEDKQQLFRTTLRVQWRLLNPQKFDRDINESKISIQRLDINREARINNVIKYWAPVVEYVAEVDIPARVLAMCTIRATTRRERLYMYGAIDREMYMPCGHWVFGCDMQYLYGLYRNQRYIFHWLPPDTNRADVLLAFVVAQAWRVLYEIDEELGAEHVEVVMLN